ncbi:hypothetical protein KBZ17_01790 [Cyanobium sp. A2C-AMD]|nr:hypothetical protein [Cyanobium sp. A2C-AMD]
MKQRHGVLVVSAPLVGGLPQLRYRSRHLPVGLMGHDRFELVETTLLRSILIY